MTLSRGMQARAARPEDAEPMLRVLCAAFGMDADAARPLYFQDPFFDLSHKRVLVDPTGEVVSCLTVIPSTLRIGAALIPTAGIAGVATLPSAQRKGYAGTLLSATVGAVADELGYPVAALFPYSYPFYRRFGWETASRAARWTGAACLPRYAEAANVRPALEADYGAIRTLHEQGTSGRTGAVLRDARRWHIIQAMTPSRETAVYDGENGAIRGYLFFERRVCDGAETIVIHEMHGETEEARRGLVGFLATQAGDHTTLDWEAGPEDLQRYGFLSLPNLEKHKPGVTLCPGMMLRLTDLPAALTHVHPTLYAPVLTHTDRTLTLRAEDSLRPDNARPVRLAAPGVEAGSVDDADWIAASIQTLAQLFIGYHTPSDAASLGLLSASSPQALTVADRLFPARQPLVAPADQF